MRDESWARPFWMPPIRRDIPREIDTADRRLGDWTRVTCDGLYLCGAQIVWFPRCPLARLAFFRSFGWHL